MLGLSLHTPDYPPIKYCNRRCCNVTTTSVTCNEHIYNTLHRKKKLIISWDTSNTPYIGKQVSPTEGTVNSFKISFPSENLRYQTRNIKFQINSIKRKFLSQNMIVFIFFFLHQQNNLPLFKFLTLFFFFLIYFQCFRFFIPSSVNHFPVNDLVSASLSAAISNPKRSSLCLLHTINLYSL